MPDELTAREKVVGLKQTSRALREGRAAAVYIAYDADPRLTEPLAQACRAGGVPVVEGRSMKELGHQCGISVGTAAAAVLAK